MENHPNTSRTMISPTIPLPPRSTRSRSTSPNKLHKAARNPETMNEIPSEVGIQREISDPQMDILDADVVPRKYKIESVELKRSNKINDSSPHDTNRQTVASVQSTVSSSRAIRLTTDDERHGTKPASKSIGIAKYVGSFFGHSNSSPSSAKQKSHHERQKPENTKSGSGEEVRGMYDANERSSIHRKEIADLNQKFQNYIERTDRKWEARERDFQQYVDLMRHEVLDTRHVLQAKLHQSESEKRGVQDEYNAFIRKQQEASFRQMESTRWLPMEEGRVIDDLDRLKRDMRSWAKGTSIKNLSLLQSLGGMESTALIQDLAYVVLLENDQLPKELSTTARSTVLLLNALLAHSVYTGFFQNPFFIFDSDDVDTLPQAKSDKILQEIYQQAQKANEQDAHTWRSETLRLLKPPLRNDASDGQKGLHAKTESLITSAAERQASKFLASPARHLIDNGTKIDFTAKLRKIFQDAASLSYMLWTRRTVMRCYTLQEMTGTKFAFDAESMYFDPDPLVRHEDHEDQLKDKPVTVMVHPLLQVYGTDEAKDYDRGRVWAKGVVWLDSRMAQVS